jgi:hypothetical protein
MNDEILNREDWLASEQALLNSLIPPSWTSPTQSENSSTSTPTETSKSDTMDKFHQLMALIDKNSDAIPDGDYLEMSNLVKDLWEKVKPPGFLIDQNEPMIMPVFFPTVAEVTRVLESDDDTQNGETWMRVMMRDATDHPSQRVEEVFSTVMRGDDEGHNTFQLLRQFPGFTVTHEFRERNGPSLDQQNSQPN